MEICWRRFSVAIFNLRIAVLLLAPTTSTNGALCQLPHPVRYVLLKGFFMPNPAFQRTPLRYAAELKR